MTKVEANAVEKPKTLKKVLKPKKVQKNVTLVPKKANVAEKVVVVKKEKVEKVEKVSNRKVNSKPILSKLTGINISPAKVKNIISNYVLNNASFNAISEIKEATPRTITRKVDGKEIEEAHPGTPVSKLSQKTRDYIKYANDCNRKTRRDEYHKYVVSQMESSYREKYLKDRAVAKSASVDETFDLHAFNSKYDKDFYNNFEETLLLKPDSEWKDAIEKISKLKIRFSTNSRIYLSAFVEYLIKQLATNGTVCCVTDKKKIIQLSHILDTSKEGFSELFSLYPLITHLETFKQAHEYLTKQASDQKGDDEVKNKNIDVFNLENLSLEKQYQFRYYIGETCRETRMDLNGQNPDDNVYNHTSVSKIFKNFCSTLVCEFLIRIGKMLEKEIETRGIKTVNDTIIKTVISQYHIVCGVSEEKTSEFIKLSTDKYHKYVDERQKKRKEDTK
jgi:hypothetical protein